MKFIIPNNSIKRLLPSINREYFSAVFPACFLAGIQVLTEEKTWAPYRSIMILAGTVQNNKLSLSWTAKRSPGRRFNRTISVMNWRNILSLKLCVLVLSSFFVSSSQANPVDVQLDRSIQLFNLGVSNISSADKKGDAALISSFQSPLTQDLDFSKLFNLIQNGPVVKGKSEVLEWAKLGSDMVLSGSIRGRGEDRWEVSIVLNDTRSGKEVLDLSRRGARAEMRFIAHDIANEVFKYFTGKPGIFNSKIVFVNDVTGRKELYIADYDGKNMKRLTNDNSIVILPRISPDGKKIVFTSYMAGNPDLYVINRDGTGRRKISAKAGLNVSPAWSPNNQDLAVTLSKDGPPNIFLMDLQGNVRQRLTDASTADTAPCFSPDGAQIAFTSDRAGAPHIYIVNIDGSGLRRITTASHCDSAAWSPDGQLITYVKSEGGNFDIFSIEVLTGIERRLTWGQGDSENPSWSPDGRFILFTSNRRGRMELFIMSADGSDQKVIPTNNGKSFTPHWSL
ncbi:MAG: Protein TolB [Elusimicrobia bacterium]|nr:Protein TolB [Elusimicrobiota bacterium]